MLLLWNLRSYRTASARPLVAKRGFCFGDSHCSRLLLHPDIGLAFDALQLQNVNGKELRISYPCVVLNVMVAKHQTNPQYATLEDAAGKTYTTSSEMSIEFEVDGPYKVRGAA